MYMGLIFGYLNLAYFFPKLLTTEQIGLVSFLLVSSNMLLSIIQLGMPSIIVKFRPIVVDKGLEKGFLRLSLVVPIISFIVIFGILFLLSDWILNRFYSNSPLIHEYYYLLPFFTFFMSFLGIWSAHGRSLFRIVVPNLVEKVGIRILVFLLLMLMSFSLINFTDFVWGYSAIFCLATLIVMFYVFQLSPRKNPENNALDLPFKKRILSFGLFSFLTVIGGQVVENIDIIMISSITNLSDAGIYKTVFYIGGVIMIPMHILGQITSPVFAEAWKDNDLDKIKEVYQKSSINLTIIGTLIFLGLYINLDNIFEIMPNGDKFLVGRNVILIIALSKLVSMTMSVNSHLIANSNHYHFNLIGIVSLAIVTIVSNYFFIPRWGIVGAAFASGLSIVTFELLKFSFIAIKFKMLPYTKQTIVALLLFLCILGLNFFLPKISNAYIDTIYRSGIITIAFGIGVYVLKISPDLNEIVHSFTKKIKG